MAKYKIVVAGCGGMAHAWIQYVVDCNSADMKIVALVDIEPANAQRYIDMHKLDCGVYADVKEAIAATGANLLFDVTIPSAHPQVVQAALNNGCNVFGEKPMAESLEDAKAMVACAQKNNKTYTVLQNYRYNAGIAAFSNIIRDGLIGQPGLLCADFFLAPHFGGFRDMMDSPLLKDMSIHTFDAARYLLQSDPVSVYCMEFNPPGSWYKGAANAIAVFEMSNGAVFCYRGSWCAEGYETSWNSTWRVQGSKGTALWDGDDSKMPSYEALDSDGEMLKETAANAYEMRSGHYGCLDDMFDKLNKGIPAQTDCTDNIKSISMVLKAVESAQTGKKIYF